MSLFKKDEAKKDDKPVVDAENVVETETPKEKDEVVTMTRFELDEMNSKIARLMKVASATKLSEVIEDEELSKMVKTVRVTTIKGKIITNLSVSKDEIKYFDNGSTKKIQEYKVEFKDADSKILSIHDFLNLKESLRVEFVKSSNDANNKLQTITVLLPDGEELEIYKEAINL